MEKNLDIKIAAAGKDEGGANRERLSEAGRSESLTTRPVANGAMERMPRLRTPLPRRCSPTARSRLSSRVVGEDSRIESDSRHLHGLAF